MFPPRKHTPGCSPSMEGASGYTDRCEVQHHRGGQERQYTQIKRSQWTPKKIRVPSGNKTVLCWFTCEGKANMLSLTSFLDQDNISHVLLEKTNHPLKQWLRPLIQHGRTASSSSRIFLIGVKLAWPSQTHHGSKSIKTISRLWHFEINY